MLTDNQKKELLKRAENIDIDIHNLESCRYYDNIYMVEDHLATGGYDYDENEYWRFQIKELADYIEHDGIENYIKFSKEDMENEKKMSELTKEAVIWLRRMIGEE